MNQKISHSFRTYLAALAISAIPYATSARDYTQWQKDLPDKAFVSTISIPGTHDTMTGYELTNAVYSTTQDKDLRQQMEMGVRAFDFRPGRKNAGTIIKKNYRLRCYHGTGTFASEIEYWFDDAIRDICAYLDEHPTEFFIIHLYPGGSDTDTSSLFEALVNADDVKDHICTFRAGLRVSDIRGKILFMKRYQVNWESDKAAYLYDWDETGWENNDGQFIKNRYEDQKERIVMQDLANSNRQTDRKCDELLKLLRFSSSYRPATERSMVWIVNMCSAYALVYTLAGNDISTSCGYARNAETVNPVAIQYIKANPGPTGIMFIDWVGDDTHNVKAPTTTSGWQTQYNTHGETLVHTIIDNNFAYLPQMYDTDGFTTSYAASTLPDDTPEAMFRGNLEWLDINNTGRMGLTMKGRDVADGWWPKYIHLESDGNSMQSWNYLPRPATDTRSEYDANASRIIASLDYNNNGKADLIYGCSDGSTILTNDGTGNSSFTHLSTLSLWGQDMDLSHGATTDSSIETRGTHGLMHTADFDMDGTTDLLIYTRANGSDGIPTIFRNEGGTFYGKDTNLPQLANGTMAIGDINGDGRPDVLVSGINSDGIRQVALCFNLGYNNNTYTFNVTYPEEMQPFATTHGAVLLVDVNNNGILDVFLTGKVRDNEHIASATANLFINNGDGTFKHPYLPAVPAFASGADWCDINSDGYADIIYGGGTRTFSGCDNDKNPIYGDATLVVLLNNGDGTFTCDNTTLPALRSGVAVRAFDYNDTGTAAIAAMGYGSQCFSVYESDTETNRRNYTLPDQLPCELSAYPGGTYNDRQIKLTWQPVADGMRYNYIVKTRDGHIHSAVPCDPDRAIQLQANIDAAPTGTSVILDIPASEVDTWGVYAIGPDKKPATAIYTAKEGISTSITSIGETTAEYETVYYNLQGIRVDTPTTPGLYISNGKKIVVH